MNASPTSQPRDHVPTNSTLVAVALIAPLVFFTCCLILSRWLSEVSERFSGCVVILTYIVALSGGMLLMWRAVGPRPLRWFAWWLMWPSVAHFSSSTCLHWHAYFSMIACELFANSSNQSLEPTAGRCVVQI